MNIAFFGDDKYSEIVLEHLFSYSQKSAKDQISLIITTQPKPKGRSGQITPSDIQILADKHNIIVSYYPDNNDDMITLIDLIKSSSIDLAVIASFGHILPVELIASIPRSIINIHPSLLPQYRGATPVPYAIALGDKITGVTLFTITSKIDEGNIITQKQHKILDSDTAPTLLSKLFELGASLLTDYLTNSKPLSPNNQQLTTEKQLIFTRRFNRNTGFIEWEIFQKMLTNMPLSKIQTKNYLLRLRLERNPSSSRGILDDLNRALTPWPGTWTITPLGKRLKIIDTHPHLLVQLEGKPNPISYDTFNKYYLS